MQKDKSLSTVDTFLQKAKKWQAEMEALRTIVLEMPLTETLKWYQPCYTYDDSNVVIIGGFKEYCVLSFFKGVLLKDPKRIMVQPTENMQAVRQLRFTNVAEIKQLEPTIKAYILEAINIEKAGLKVNMKKSREYTIPGELEAVFSKKPDVKTAFLALTPGRQRAYILFFSAAKQSSTRVSRIEKSIPQILEGKGLND
ncbi:MULTISPECIES: YdeI/OmpD-associated family protein [Chitinophagaceae]